jgi:hypothetical protein
VAVWRKPPAAIWVPAFQQSAPMTEKPSTTNEQARFALRMIRRPVHDPARYQRVWKEHVEPLNGAYRMRP